MNMDITTRKQASDIGLTTYYTGILCKNGHLTYRYTSSGTCSGCVNDPNKSKAPRQISDARLKLAQQRQAMREKELELKFAREARKAEELALKKARPTKKRFENLAVKQQWILLEKLDTFLSFLYASVVVHHPDARLEELWEEVKVTGHLILVLWRCETEDVEKISHFALMKCHVKQNPQPTPDIQQKLSDLRNMLDAEADAGDGSIPTGDRG